MHCGVKPFQYPTLLQRFLEAKMVALLNSDNAVIENPIFGVWKNVGISQRLIWAGNPSNILWGDQRRWVANPRPCFYHVLGQGWAVVPCVFWHITILQPSPGPFGSNSFDRGFPHWGTTARHRLFVRIRHALSNVHLYGQHVRCANRAKSQ